MKSLIVYLMYLVLLSEIVIAKEKEIKIENNQYQMENVCLNLNKISNKQKLFGRYYKFIFKSKYNVFENYAIKFNAYNPLVFKTNLYKINVNNLFIDLLLPDNYPKILKNKKTIEILLNEDDMKKLYESNSAKVVFPPSLFSNNYTKYSYTRLDPVISIDLNIDNLNKERAKCTEKETKYIKEYEKYHSKPMNRIKNFFNF